MKLASDAAKSGMGCCHMRSGLQYMLDEKCLIPRTKRTTAWAATDVELTEVYIIQGDIKKLPAFIIWKRR
ncbi:MAG: hypothetical protein HFG73_02490 [Hungatella sp.]|nr:hypothetical protein [Hungatella sp.]